MKSKLARMLCGIGAVLGASLSLLFLTDHDAMIHVTAWLISFLDILTDGAFTPIHLQTLAFLCGIVFLTPAALCSGLAWLIPTRRRNALIISISFASVLTIFAAVMMLTREMDPAAELIGFLSTALGGFGSIGCILLYGWLQKKLPSVFNRETISYIVFGVLTTVVSFVSQMLFSSLGWHVTVNTIGSWVCAVLFAYVVNKLFVFESKTDTAKAFWRELGLFIGARVASLGMELVFMFVTVELMSFSEAICKLIAQVFILIANYIFSKLIIFKKR